MEHRVKQRSQEWLKLRRSVTLTASQFGDAVGVGKGKPFHFFQSLVEREEGGMNEDDISESEKEMMKHGEQMENVIKEAYELLTGLYVLESGFWTPKEHHSMEGLIGASPDGVVVSEKDVDRMLGLAEFKAPIHKLYDKIPSIRHGIPRRYMVQIQGQMAVCGAPWCDFMAVCSNTEDIMLKRVYFQPRYWEHIASRLRQFCFALQEAEIMGELRRDVYSGAMTQRIKSLPIQDKLFPAEDIISVENLLTRSPLQLYRGPSQKLLSYQILVGDSYVLPPTLTRYQQDLLAKVDGEISIKTPHLDKDQASIEEEELGRVLQRVFYEDDKSLSPVSVAETVLRECSAVRGKENQNVTVSAAAADGKTPPSVVSCKDKLMKNSAGPLSSGDTPLSGHTTAKGGSVTPQNTPQSQSRLVTAKAAQNTPHSRLLTAKDSTSTPQNAPQSRLVVAKGGSSTPQNAPQSKFVTAKGGSATPQNAPQSKFVTAKGGSATPQNAPHSRPVTGKDGSSPAQNAPQRKALIANTPHSRLPSAKVGSSTPHTAPHSRLQTAKGSSSTAQNFPRPLTAKSSTAAQQSTPQQSPSAVPSPTPSSAQAQAQAPRTGSPQFRKLSRINAGPRPQGLSRSTAVHSQPRAVGAVAQRQIRPGLSPRSPVGVRAPRAALSAPGVQRNMHRPASARNVTPKVAAKSPMLTRVSGSSPRTTLSAARISSPKRSVSSASFFDETSGGGSGAVSSSATAQGSQVNRASLSTSATSVISTARSTTVHTANRPSSQARLTAQAKSRASAGQTTSAGNVSLPTRRNQEKMEGETSSQDQNVPWQAKVLSSGSSFVPPGLTLLSSSSATHTLPTRAVDMTAGGGSRPTSQQHAASQPELAVTSGAREDQQRLSTGHEAHKRLATSAPEVEPSKRPLIDQTPGMHHVQGDERSHHRPGESLPIHRPWQSQEGGRGEQGGVLERQRGVGSERQRSGERQPAFGREAADHDRPHDLGSHPIHPEDHVRARIPSVLDRGRDEAPLRVMDHQDHVKDFQQRAPSWGRGQHGLRGTPMSAAAQFESMRHVPLDLSERHHHHQEGDLFSSRNTLMGREGLDSGGWRGGQFPRQMAPQIRPQWSQLQARPDPGPSIRNPLHGNWQRGQGLLGEGQHAMDLQSHLRGRDPRMGGPRLDFHGDLIRGQFPRNFPRRPFDY
ncbi:hypothetical protein ACOMHN_034777 [Nucella lapillus]